MATPSTALLSRTFVLFDLRPCTFCRTCTGGGRLLPAPCFPACPCLHFGLCLSTCLSTLHLLHGMPRFSLLALPLPCLPSPAVPAGTHGLADDYCQLARMIPLLRCVAPPLKRRAFAPYLLFFLSMPHGVGVLRLHYLLCRWRCMPTAYWLGRNEHATQTAIAALLLPVSGCAYTLPFSLGLDAVLEHTQRDGDAPATSPIAPTFYYYWRAGSAL